MQLVVGDMFFSQGQDLLFLISNTSTSCFRFGSRFVARLRWLLHATSINLRSWLLSGYLNLDISSFDARVRVCGIHVVIINC